MYLNLKFLSQSVNVKLFFVFKTFQQITFFKLLMNDTPVYYFSAIFILFTLENAQKLLWINILKQINKAINFS